MGPIPREASAWLAAGAALRRDELPNRGIKPLLQKEPKSEQHDGRRVPRWRSPRHRHPPKYLSPENLAFHPVNPVQNSTVWSMQRLVPEFPMGALAETVQLDHRIAVAGFCGGGLIRMNGTNAALLGWAGFRWRHLVCVNPAGRPALGLLQSGAGTLVCPGCVGP